MSFLKQPSLRTPDMHFNCADHIEKFLKEDDHQIWGFVIYRCTYSDDDGWRQFIESLNTEIHGELKFYSGLDMMDSLRVTVFEDKSKFDRASDSVIREYFKKWAAIAPEEEQGPDAGRTLREKGGEGTAAGRSQRYRYSNPPSARVPPNVSRYCIQVDEESLESILDDDPKSARKEGWVNLIWTGIPDFLSQSRDPVKDMPWMRVSYQDVMVGFYDRLRGWTDWYTEYRSPPEVAVD
jgi:hypothetical protein